jgi:hypothetical protein
MIAGTLAMGKRVLASEAVCRTFLPEMPKGITCCRSADDYVRAIEELPAAPAADVTIADSMRRQFRWDADLAPLVAELDNIEKFSGSLPR